MLAGLAGGGGGGGGVSGVTHLERERQRDKDGL